jgi:hypothetical protein
MIRRGNEIYVVKPAAWSFGNQDVQSVFVLIRRISAYTSPDVLLGVFATRDEADAAKVNYARVREADPDGDPWKDQGYKPNMVVSQDVVVHELPGTFSTGATVFVVSDHCDGFGQELRKLDSIHVDSSAAAARVEELDAVVHEKFPFPHYAVVDPLVVGSLHSDLPEDQPQPEWRQRPNQQRGARRLFRDVQPTCPPGSRT